MTLETVLADHDGKDYARRVLEATEVCFRPGTDRFPMDNAIRQAEMSHKDVYGKVTRPVDQP